MCISHTWGCHPESGPSQILGRGLLQKNQSSELYLVSVEAPQVTYISNVSAANSLLFHHTVHHWLRPGSSPTTPKTEPQNPSHCSTAVGPVPPWSPRPGGPAKCTSPSASPMAQERAEQSGGAERSGGAGVARGGFFLKLMELLLQMRRRTKA